MSAIPPNNLDQLIAWVRIFAQETNQQLASLKQSMLELEKTVKEKGS